MGASDYIIPETDPSGPVVHINGRWMRDVTLTMGEDSLRKIAQGYMCINCLEDFTRAANNPGAFPEKCPNDWCQYPMSAQQKKDYEQHYGGIDWGYVKAMQKAEDAGIVLPD